MSRRLPIGLVLAVLFLVVNLAGAVMAGAMGELPHAGLHAALSLLGAYLVWRLAARSRSRRLRAAGVDAALVEADALADRLAQLEQSVDTVAIEVERVGEGQRFMTRVLTEQRAPAAPDADATAPVQRRRPGATPSEPVAAPPR